MRTRYTQRMFRTRAHVRASTQMHITHTYVAIFCSCSLGVVEPSRLLHQLHCLRSLAMFLEALLGLLPVLLLLWRSIRRALCDDRSCSRPCRCCYYTKSSTRPDGSWSCGWRWLGGTWTWVHDGAPHCFQQALNEQSWQRKALRFFIPAEAACPCCFYKTVALGATPTSMCGWHLNFVIKRSGGGSWAWAWSDHEAPHRRNWTNAVPRSHIVGTAAEALFPPDGPDPIPWLQFKPVLYAANMMGQHEDEDENEGENDDEDEAPLPCGSSRILSRGIAARGALVLGGMALAKAAETDSEEALTQQEALDLEEDETYDTFNDPYIQALEKEALQREALAVLVFTSDSFSKKAKKDADALHTKVVESLQDDPVALLRYQKKVARALRPSGRTLREYFDLDATDGDQQMKAHVRTVQALMEETEETKALEETNDPNKAKDLQGPKDTTDAKEIEYGSMAHSHVNLMIRLLRDEPVALAGETGGPLEL